MDSFIDLQSNITYTPEQIDKRLRSIELSRYPIRDQEVLNRIQHGITTGAYTPTADEVAWLQGFQAFLFELVIYSALVRTENQLLIDTLAYEEAVVRLARYELELGRPEEPIYETQSIFNEDTMMYEDQQVQVGVIPAVEPLDLMVDQPVYDEDGNQTGVESVVNPLIVTDRAERAAAENVVANATKEAIDLAGARK